MLIDENLKNYIVGLDPEKIGKAVVFSTSWISKHAIDLIKSGLKEKGIPVEKESLHFRGKPGHKQLEEACAFAGKFI